MFTTAVKLYITIVTNKIDGNVNCMGLFANMGRMNA